MELSAKTSVPAIGPSLATPSQLAVSVSDWPGWRVSLVVGWDAAPGSDSQIWAGPLVALEVRPTRIVAFARIGGQKLVRIREFPNPRTKEAAVRASIQAEA